MAHGAVDAEIDRLLAEGAGRAGALQLADHDALWQALCRAVRGGKRARPALLLDAHAALAGTRTTAAVQVGAALEILHTAFVVQDDVIDGDLLRRGAPSVRGSIAEAARRAGADALGARRLGEAGGILTGDLGLMTALRAIRRCDAPPQVVDALLDRVERCVHVTVAGEFADVRLPLQAPGEMRGRDDELAVAELKTADYSFRLPLHAAALLADAPTATIDALEEIGGLLGIGFQLHDDLLGMFGDERRTGKSALGDLREGKRTALIAHAATTPAWSELRPMLGRTDLGPAQARRARDLLVETGSRAWVEDLALWHLDRGLERAAEHGLPAPLLEVLRAATDRILRTTDLLLPGEPSLHAVDGMPA
ncbi:polyprenyl synthetase family protein [Brachybacterium sp. DNPG3]